ncbi:MAG TPA: hypothetical protein VE573_03185 [Nitrososphaeraceae archaeon]|nr:hypothetical protein [Nitrososphaeraceae archaeon]
MYEKLIKIEVSYSLAKPKRLWHLPLLALNAGVLPGHPYLQYHQIANINWNELQTVSEDAITTLSNAIIQIPTFGNTNDQAAASLTMTSFDIPLTGSMYAGFTIGFMKE